jgi:hypothetical protein
VLALSLIQFLRSGGLRNVAATSTSTLMTASAILSLSSCARNAAALSGVSQAS